jgi:ribosome-binding factor A
MAEGRRGQRVSEDIREYLAEILRNEVSDPRLTALVVTTVKLSPDLGLADISVRSLVGGSSEREQQSIVRALTGAAGRLRHLLGTRLNMKRNPQLRFHYDTAPEVRGRVDDLLDEIRREDEERGGSD